MKINYITNVRIPTSRAQGFAIMKMCNEFANTGCQITLYVPNKTNNEENKDAFDFYKINKNFEIKYISNPDTLSITFLKINEIFGRILYWIDVICFFVLIKFTVPFSKGDIFYTRDYLAPLFINKPDTTVLELHDLPVKKWLLKEALKKTKMVVVLNSFLKKEIEELGYPANRIFILPSGVDLEEFRNTMSKKDAKAQLKIPEDKRVILYSGQFYAWKGVEVLAQTAELDKNNLYVFIGGTDPELSDFKKKYSIITNINILPFVDRSKLSTYFAAADIFALPNSGKEQISVKYTSPLKLYEYMASKRPIVAADLPSIREAVDSSCVYFAQADNPESFAKMINEALQSKETSGKKVDRAYEVVQGLTWDKRAKKILSILNV